MKDIIVIPTYNEKENIKNIIGRVTELYPDKEIFVVDDNSPDGTRAIVLEMASTNSHIKLFTRSEKTGLGDAYKFIHEKIQKMSDVRYVVTMDADGSHDPASIKSLFEVLEKYDFAVGSRYVRGGKVTGWDRKRLALSYFGNIYSNLITGSPVKDGTAGFVAFRADALRSIDLKEISSAGYSYQIEFKGAMLKAGKTFKEVPITFSERQVGKSKMSGHIIFEGILMPWKILRKNKKMLKERLRQIAVVVVFLAAIFLGTFRITESPPVWYDEGIYMQSAANFLVHGTLGLQFSPEVITPVWRITVSYPLFYPLAAWFKVFGINIVAARFFMVSVMLLFLFVSYRLVKKIYGGGAALCALILLATFSPLYGNGKSVLGEVPGLLYLVAGLLFLNISKSSKGKKDFWLVLSGISVGLSAVTKPIFIVLVPAFILGLLLEWKRGVLRLRDIFLSLVSVALPFLAWLLIQFQKSDSLSSVMRFYVNPYQVTSLSVLILQNLKTFFTSATPLYLLIMMVVWTIALILRYFKKIKIPSEEIISFIFCGLIIAAYLRIAGLYRYIFPAQIVAIIYFASSLQFITTWFSEKFGGKFSIKKYSNVLFIAPIAGLVLFGMYGLLFNSWVADSYGSHKTAFWEEYFDKISKVSPGEIFFFYNVPEVTVFSKNKNYYQFVEPNNGGPFSTKELVAIENGVPDKVIIQTVALPNISSKLKKYYRPFEDVYKYTIFEKIPKK